MRRRAFLRARGQGGFWCQAGLGALGRGADASAHLRRPKVGSRGHQRHFPLPSASSTQPPSLCSVLPASAASHHPPLPPVHLDHSAPPPTPSATMPRRTFSLARKSSSNDVRHDVRSVRGETPPVARSAGAATASAPPSSASASASAATSLNGDADTASGSGSLSRGSRRNSIFGFVCFGRSSATHVPSTLLTTQCQIKTPAVGAVRAQPQRQGGRDPRCTGPADPRQVCVQVRDPLQRRHRQQVAACGPDRDSAHAAVESGARRPRTGDSCTSSGPHEQRCRSSDTRTGAPAGERLGERPHTFGTGWRPGFDTKRPPGCGTGDAGSCSRCIWRSRALARSIQRAVDSSVCQHVLPMGRRGR